MTNEKVKNKIEISNEIIKLNGALIAPSHLELILDPDGILKIKLELEGFAEDCDVNLDYD